MVYENWEEAFGSRLRGWNVTRGSRDKDVTADEAIVYDRTQKGTS